MAGKGKHVVMERHGMRDLIIDKTHIPKGNRL